MHSKTLSCSRRTLDYYISKGYNFYNGLVCKKYHVISTKIKFVQRPKTITIMITQEQQIQGAELVKTLAQKAWESTAFKEQLVSNPLSAIESVTGQKMSPETKIVVEDQTDESTIYLNIPRKIEYDGLELTDEQLEMVAGGSTPVCLYGGYALICVGLIAAGVQIGEGIGNAVKQ